MNIVTSIVFSAVLTLGSFADVVFGQSVFDLPDPGLTPESPIYFLDLWDENARLFFTRSDSSRLKRYQARMSERLSEADVLAGKGISATQLALELYRQNIPFFYSTAERLSDDRSLADALDMASDHLDVLDHISERTDFEKKRFILATKIFIIEQQLQSLHAYAKRDPVDAFRVFGDALQRRMARIREVAIDDQNNQEAFNEYAAYTAESDRIVREWGTVQIEGLSPAAFLAQIVQSHEETLLGSVRDRITPALENELLLAVNNVRKLSGKEHLPELPPVQDSTQKEPCLVGALVAREGEQEYSSKEAEFCATALFACNTGCQVFVDETGCGCRPVEVEKKNAIQTTPPPKENATTTSSWQQPP